MGDLKIFALVGILAALAYGYQHAKSEGRAQCQAEYQAAASKAMQDNAAVTVRRIENAAAIDRELQTARQRAAELKTQADAADMARGALVGRVRELAETASRDSAPGDPATATRTVAERLEVLGSVLGESLQRVERLGKLVGEGKERVRELADNQNALQRYAGEVCGVYMKP